MADENTPKDERSPQSSDAPKRESVNEQPNDKPGKVEAAQAAGPDFVGTTDVTEDDFPSVEDEAVNVKRGDDSDPNEGWTVQSVNDEDNPRTYEVPEAVPGYVVTKAELPTREGLEALGVDPVAYVAAVPVVEG
jgi:hypothetical protein